MANHPIQPAEVDSEGVRRFKANSIVRHLLDNGGMDLNHLALLGFPDEDWRQFAQLIGYSVSGWSGLSYVDGDSAAAARRMIEEEITEEQARCRHAEAELRALREALREPMADLFGVHPDDLRRNL